MTTSFAVTWDYRCPFARNASEHILTALDGGADWDVTWVPFSLNQAHVEEGDRDVWDDPTKAPSLLAMQAGDAQLEAPAGFTPIPPVSYINDGRAHRLVPFRRVP